MGMEKEYGGEGFQIVDMPSGQTDRPPLLVPVIVGVLVRIVADPAPLSGQSSGPKASLSARTLPGSGSPTTRVACGDCSDRGSHRSYGIRLYASATKRILRVEGTR